MRVYLVIDSGGYEGNNATLIPGICSTIDKAKEIFSKRVDDVKYDIDENWEFEETETSFYASEIGRCSRNWIHIWIEESEVI